MRHVLELQIIFNFYLAVSQGHRGQCKNRKDPPPLALRTCLPPGFFPCGALICPIQYPLIYNEGSRLDLSLPYLYTQSQLFPFVLCALFTLEFFDFLKPSYLSPPTKNVSHSPLTLLTHPLSLILGVTALRDAPRLHTRSGSTPLPPGSS